MNKLCIGASLVVLFAASAVLAAQAPGMGGMMAPGMMGQGGNIELMLLNVPQVQKELNIVQEQLDKLQEIRRSAMEGMRDLFPRDFRDLSAEERQKRMEEVRKKMEERTKELRKKVDEVLLDHQKKRLKEIKLQVQGVQALSDPEVIEMLGITPEQREKMENVRKEAADKQRKQMEGLRDLSPEERREKGRQLFEEMGKAREATEKAVLDVLTPSQKEKWEKAKGEKFELDMSALFRRPGGQQRPQPKPEN